MAFDPAKPLREQKAIVTGASSGIGAAVARRFATAGATVGVNYRGDREPADKVVREIEARGGEAIALEADVSQEAAVEAMFAKFLERHGRIDILVANAGIQKDAPFAEMSLDQWHAVLEVNLTGYFLSARAAVRQFLKQGIARTVSCAAGKILFMSSVHEAIPWAGHVNYAASKGGTMQLMKSLAQEVADKRIRVNGIAPGAIKTNINRSAWETPLSEAELVKLIPYGRLGEPDDVAAAAIWLASDASDYVVGTTLFIDGGMSLCPGFREGG